MAEGALYLVHHSRRRRRRRCPLPLSVTENSNGGMQTLLCTLHIDQGENNCGMQYVGNSAEGTGYGCELPAMVRDWRAVWSRVPDTTDPLAPFGIATLAAGASIRDTCVVG